jgi:hypothetical protein
MKFICKFCNYETDKHSSHEKHLESYKHIRKRDEVMCQSKTDPKLILNRSSSSNHGQENAYQCLYCENEYSNSSNLMRHKKICSKKGQIETKFNNELEKKETEIQQLKELYEKDTTQLKELYEKDTTQLKELYEKDTTHLKELYKKDTTHLKELIKQEKQKSEELNKKSEKEIEHLKSLINKTGSIVKTSVSALSFVTENYANAPVLMKLPDYTYIRNPKIDNDNDDDDDDDDDIDDEPFNLIETLIYHIKKGILQEYLGMIVVEAYKKDDPAKQAIWNSDSSRLTYIIRDIINKKPDWTVDKGGIKTAQQIIDPLLNFVRDEVSSFIEENSLPENVKVMSQYQLKKLAEKLTYCSQIIASIDNKTMSKLVLKYIAPYFYLAKPEHMIEAD